MRPDETVSLGRTGVQVTRLGVGCAWFGNLYQAVPEDAAAAVLARAFELGIRLVDTAPLYGSVSLTGGVVGDIGGHGLVSVQ